MSAHKATADGTCKTPCPQCPWRISNHGKRHPNGFFTKKNLTRLWKQLRRGGKPQSCHLTDPSHPDHVTAGAPANATAQECPGSVILILREIQRLAGDNGEVSPLTVDAYLRSRRRGLTRSGILYWIVQRIQFAGVPLIGGTPLPSVDHADATVDLPEHLKEGN